MSSRRLSLTNCALSIGVLALAAIAIVPAAPSASGAEEQAVIAGNHADEAAELTSGEIQGNRALRVEVSMALRNRGQLEELIAQQQDPSSPLYHRWLTTAEFNDRFGPAAEDVAKVQEWLARSGFSVEPGSGAVRNVVASAPASIVEKTFAVKIAASADGSTFANLNDPIVPASIVPLIGSIRGLENTMRVHHDLVSAQPDATEGNDTAFGPKDMWTFYDETALNSSGTTGSGADCIAVVETSDVEDGAIALFDATFALPVANVTRVLADGTNPGTVPGSPLVEAELDVEYAHAAAPGTPISVYIGTGPSALVDGLARAVSDNTCGAISLSFEFCGEGPAFYQGTLDPLLAQAQSQGQAVFVAAGDEGAAGLKATSSGCVIAGGARKVSELAADPHVVAVGGTQFTPTFSGGNDVGYSTESVWHDKAPIPKSMRGAGGGGQSAIFAKPSFQAQVFPRSKRRSIPDISFAAAPSSPGFFLATGTPPSIACCFGGTSMGAPVWAGISALGAQSAGVARVGNINAKLYSLGPSGNTSSSGLHDITTGNNSLDGVAGFQAKPGYDRATGWGTPDIGILAPMLGP